MNIWYFRKTYPTPQANKQNNLSGLEIFFPLSLCPKTETVRHVDEGQEVL